MPPARRELLFVTARNEHVTSGLQAAYAAKAPAGRLDVFCVSNRWYHKFSRKGNAELVQASGIPALRKFCHSITADAQLREARHFLQASLFTLVNSAELWVGGRLRKSQPHQSHGTEQGHQTILSISEGMVRLLYHLAPNCPVLLALPQLPSLAAWTDHHLDGRVRCGNRHAGGRLSFMLFTTDSWYDRYERHEIQWEGRRDMLK